MGDCGIVERAPALSWHSASVVCTAVSVYCILPLIASLQNAPLTPATAERSYAVLKSHSAN